MATGEVAELPPLPIDSEGDEEIDDDDGGNAALSGRARPSAPASVLHWQIHRRRHSRWRLDYRHLDPGIFAPPRPPSSSFLRIGRGTPPGSDSGSDSDDLGDEGAFAVDLFEPNSPRRSGGMGLDPFRDDVGPLRIGAFDGLEEMGADYHEVGRGIGLGFEVEKLREEEGSFDGVYLEERSDWGDGFLVSWRSIALDSASGNGEPSSLRGGEGLRSIVGFGLDSDSDAEGEGDIAGSPHSDDLDVLDGIEDLGLPLCWDCLRIEEESRDPNEDFDWEEVDGRVDEREVLSAAIGAGEDRSIVQEEADAHLEIEGEDEEEETARNVEWEVLLAVNDLERNAAVEYEGAESFPADEHEGFVYTSEYEILVGQLADHDSFIKGNPPAAKSVAEDLPSVVLTQVDAANNNTLCAVCNDEISMEEMAKQLPCAHHYHADCILQWLRIRNTCPVCRYELPTDDPDYENWRAQRASNGGAVHESHVSLYLPSKLCPKRSEGQCDTAFEGDIGGGTSNAWRYFLVRM